MPKLKIKDLLPDDANFNLGTEFGNSLIDKSLSKFGAGRSILIDKNNRIIAGNKTIENAAANGFDDIVIVETTGEQIVAVKRTDIDLNTKKGREMALADNATAKANISWDAQTLTEWEMPLQEWGIDLSDITEVEPAGDADAEPQIDKAAELNKKWGVVSGDLWQIGEHRLLCGDSTKRKDVERLMGNERMDLCVTSPPYNAGKGKGFKSDYKGKVTSFYQEETDNRTEQEWIEFCEDILLRCSEIARSDKSVVVWNVMYNANCRGGYGKVMFRGVQPFTVKETICWDKGNGFPSASKGILSRNWELVFVLSLGETYNTTQGDNEVRWAKWDISRPTQLDEHKATYPTELAEQAIKDFSVKSSTIFEPFAGSGTNLVACQNLNRKCYAIEISENYCAVILERMSTAFPDLEIKRIDG